MPDLRKRIGTTTAYFLPLGGSMVTAAYWLFLRGNGMLRHMTEAFGKRLQAARKRAGIRTQDDLAKLIGVSGKTIRNWETDQVKNIDASHLETLRGLLGNFDDQGDRVVAAINETGLDEWRRAALVSEYQRHLHQQAREREGMPTPAGD